MQKITPVIRTNIHDLRTDLIQNGWGVYQLLTPTENELYLQQTKYELEMLNVNVNADENVNVNADENGNGDVYDPFYKNIPRVLSGMIKHYHASMTRTAHELRKKIRPIFYELMDDDVHGISSFLEHPIPLNENELSCNPDAIYVSSSKRPIFPQSVRNQINPNDLLWWHVDTDVPISFIQSSIVLQNPEGSEEFCVYNGSHRYMNEINGGELLPSDFYLLSTQDQMNLQEKGCQPMSMQIPPGCAVLWFSSTVHTVKPFNNALLPRIQYYVCYGVIKHLGLNVIQDLKHMKTLAILLGGSCRHLPYPCSVTWQNGDEHLFRDLINPHELNVQYPNVFFGTRAEDLTDTELSIYGLTRKDVHDSIEYWKINWTRSMELFDFLAV